jgi:hypothetical protein
MMVVMTMMEVELHLRNNPKQDGLVCQICRHKFYLRILRPNAGFSVNQGAELRDALPIRDGYTGSYAGSYAWGGLVRRTEACGIGGHQSREHTGAADGAGNDA